VSTTLRVSVYVPCFNGEAHIRRCIDALFRQTCPVAEILIVDDGSSDATAAIVRQFSHVTLIHHDVNQGLSAARNTGLRAARHAWVGAVDADVEVAPDWLERLTGLRHEFPEATGFGGKLVETHTRTRPDLWRCAHIPQEWGVQRRVNPPFLYGCNHLFRKDHVLAVGGYDERLRTNGEDVDLSSRLYGAGRTLVYDPTATAYHHRSDDLASVLGMFWAHHRHPEAVITPPKDILELGRFILRNLSKRSLRMAFRDFLAGRFGLLPISLLTLIDGPWREIQAFRKINSVSEETCAF